MNEGEGIPDCVYHYCSVRALQGIVKSGLFRLSNAFFMNDYMEVEWFMSICRKVIKEERDKAAQHGRFYNELERWLSVREFDHIYCGCFSKACDDLSQWRGYADDGRGVAIELDLKAIIAAADNAARPPRRRRVEYCEETQKAEARKIIQERASKVSVKENEFVSATNQAHFGYMVLRALAPEFKNPRFSSEQEVRLIADDGRTSNWLKKDVYVELDTERLPSGVDFWDRDGKLIPFVTIAFPPDAFLGVWLGPRFGDELDESAIRYFLSKHGVDVKDTIHRSAATYR